MLGLGAVGVVTGKAVQSGINTVLAPVQRLDPTGLTGLLPGDYFRWSFAVLGDHRFWLRPVKAQVMPDA